MWNCRKSRGIACLDVLGAGFNLDFYILTIRPFYDSIDGIIIHHRYINIKPLLEHFANEEMLNTMNGLVLRFFDCYLKGEGTFEVNEYY